VTAGKTERRKTSSRSFSISGRYVAGGGESKTILHNNVPNERRVIRVHPVVESHSFLGATYENRVYNGNFDRKSESVTQTNGRTNNRKISYQQLATDGRRHAYIAAATERRETFRLFLRRGKQNYKLR
jgi:hypothetical protein